MGRDTPNEFLTREDLLRRPWREEGRWEVHNKAGCLQDTRLDFGAASGIVQPVQIDLSEIHMRNLVHSPKRGARLTPELTCKRVN